ncbi:cathepsin B-like [Galleria mellonella]|uniref:Cathepsin B-like n=1 Tax=Galleria mellonella TaxID=7137 RepID=A0ABM3MLP8_GALME|nr:cathepsin B-like [Galleria mellonella]
MTSLTGIFVMLLFSLTVAAIDNLHPLSDEFIDLINKKQNLWRAGRNFPSNIPFRHIKGLMGVLPNRNFEKFNTMTHDTELRASLPENFDPRDKWPNCPSLNEIRDQGSCGSCWAFGAVEAMTDRVCIHSNGTQHFHFSAEDVVSCCKDCGDGCHGGLPKHAWRYYQNVGIVSGGNYDSNQGCRPYSILPCEHHVPGPRPQCDSIVNTPKCIKSCQAIHNTQYEKDKQYAKHVYFISEGEDQIKAELYKNGPVEASFQVYADLITYKDGVYKHVYGDFLGLHAVKIIGWGVENGAKYWLVANSWNTDWGNKGFFKFLRGENHCNIESEIVTGIPLLVNI